jgi:hypothetical protein
MILCSHRNKLLLALSLLLLIALALGGLWVTNAFGWRGFRLADVESSIGASLPAGADDIHFVTENEKSRIIWLRFTLPADTDLTSFLDTMNLTDTLRDHFTPFPNPNYKEVGIEWWTPQAAQTYTGIHSIHSDKVYEALIDTTDANRQIIYLRVYFI